MKQNMSEATQYLTVERIDEMLEVAERLLAEQGRIVDARLLEKKRRLEEWKRVLEQEETR